MKTRCWCLLNMLCGALLLSVSASASEMSYRLGKRLGHETTSSAWSTVSPEGNCHYVDDLVAPIARAVEGVFQTQQGYSEEEMIDFAEGFIHGMQSSLAEIASHCVQKCGSLGEVAGTVSAIAFCHVAKQVSRVPVFRRQQNMPNITCGTPYKLQCELYFERFTKTNAAPPQLQTCCDCNHYAKGSDYESYYQALEHGCCSYIRQD